MADPTVSVAATVVHIVGAGPGDPGLITLRARELLDRCDVVVYDAALPRALLPEPRTTTLPERHAIASESDGGPNPDRVGQLLVRYARAGRRVVRLHHGDPFLFGRGSAEAQAVAEAGLDFEVVPGVPAELAGPAAAGVPLAHPGLASAVTIATAAADPRTSPAPADWEALARTGGTVVVRAAIAKLAHVTAGLRAGGMPDDVPVALVSAGTTARQRVVTGTAASIAADAVGAGLDGDAIAVFGWPVVLRDELAWLERRPLHGRRIVVTRPEGDRELAGRLRELGADVLHVPATRIEPLALDALVQALGRLGDYRFVVFTSRHAVRVAWETLRHLERDARAFGGLVVCAVGHATAAALAERGIVADVVPERFSAEGLVEVLASRDDVRGARVLYPAAGGARDVIPRGLAALGADVDMVSVYRSEPASVGSDAVRELRAALRKNEIDAVTFTAPSTVAAYVHLVGTELAGAAAAVTIGEVTSEAARAAGLTVAAEAAPSTTEGLARALVRLWEDEEA